MGSHGTKVIVYNLWFTDDGNLEFDLQSDPEVCFFLSLPSVIGQYSISIMYCDCLITGYSPGRL